MEFNHTTLSLPIHPGSPVYVIDEGRGWSIRKETAAAICITEDELMVVTTTTEPGEDGFEKLCFATEEAARDWAEKNRPEPPYPYWYDAKEWMKTDTWCPAFNGWYYVRIQNAQNSCILKAYYSTGHSEYENEADISAGFYQDNSINTEKLENVAAWIDSCFDLDYVMHAADFDLNEHS